MARVIALPRRAATFPRLAAVTACTVALLLALTVVTLQFVSPVGAQESDSTTGAEISTTEVTIEGPSSVGNILPRPNSGQAPDSANDPGGWQQYLVFALIGLGLLAIVVLATRDSRRIRRAQGRYP